MAKKSVWNKRPSPRKAVTDDQIRRMFNEGMKNSDVIRNTGLSEYMVYKAKVRIFGETRKSVSGQEKPTKPPRAFPHPDNHKIVVEFTNINREGYINRNYVSLPRIASVYGEYQDGTINHASAN